MLTFGKNVRVVATIVLVPKHSVLRPWYMSAMCTSADWNVAVGEQLSLLKLISHTLHLPIDRHDED